MTAASRLHRSAVTNGARRTARRQPDPPAPAPKPVNAAKVDPETWAAAMAAAGGIRGRVRVISPRVVIVVNHADLSWPAS